MEQYVGAGPCDGALNFGALVVWNTHVVYQGTSCWNIIMCRSVCCPAAECACVCVCACEGGCHGHHPKKVCVHRDLPCTSGEASEVSQQFSSICWQGVVADVGNIFLVVGMMQQFSYGLHVWR